ncbi:MAG: hypothetical protein DMD91_16195 [Candidatus Rokuibacteriota bacterium]|nr:MAG: hypothetical protein DMD91_16195 [Candidatus Rokubacteria bacterium]
MSVPPETGERYCVLVKYQGAWTTIAGQSPGGSGMIPAGIDGTFQGGYRAIVVGELNETGSVKLRGRAPSLNRLWPTQPNPAPDDWIERFFTSINSVELVWWGWIYHGGPNSTFVHACDHDINHPNCPDNSGNITN